MTIWKLEYMISTFSKQCMKPQQWILPFHAQKYTVGILTNYHDLYSWADWFDVFYKLSNRLIRYKFYVLKEQLDRYI